jgi:hypothetical protein
VGECSTLDQYFGWNIAAGNTEQQFIECFVSTMLKVLETGKFSLVEADRLSSWLGWGILAEQLEKHYSRLAKGALVDQKPDLHKPLSV